MEINLKRAREMAKKKQEAETATATAEPAVMTPGSDDDAEPETNGEPAEKPRKRRMKQSVIPGTGPERIEALDEAAERLHETRSQRIALTEEETARSDTLIMLMIEHKLTKYVTDFDGVDVEVNLLSTAKVKVRKVKKDGENGGWE